MKTTLILLAVAALLFLAAWLLGRWQR